MFGSASAGVNAEGLRRTFGCFPSGVTAICAMVDGVPVGMAVSSFAPISLDPPLVSISLKVDSSTWPKLRDRTRIGLSVLSESHDEACRKLSLKQGDRFADIDWATESDGSVFLRDSSAWLNCSLHSELPAGDHVIALLLVHATVDDSEVEPLVFHRSRFRKIVEREGRP